jgi:hypothetical protein
MSLTAFCKSRLVRIAVIAALAALAGTFVFQNTAHAADYGTKTTYRKNVALIFPDFDLTYLGERSVSAAPYPRPFIYQDFRVARGGKTQTVSWTTGTGIIEPTAFTFAGKNYTLELRRSERRGKLGDSELVIERAAKQARS